MQRRSFLTLLGGAAAVWSVEARAQQDGRMRRVAVLSTGTETDPFQRANLTVLRETLAKLGWMEGRNLRLDVRFDGGDLNLIHSHAPDLLSFSPDVIVVGAGTSATTTMQQLTKTIPIVFTQGGDPVVGGVVRSLARPEGNTTGFTNFEPTFAGKWMELLKEAVPRLTRVALLLNAELATTAVGPAYVSAIEAAARTFALQTSRLPFHDAIEIVRGIDAFAAEPDGGLVVLPPPPQAAIRDTIIRLAAQHRLPAIYSVRIQALAGGLMSYGSNIAEQYRGAAGYVDRLLRGAKINELPVQFPTKFELVVNLKTAKAIGLTIPEAFLLRADELIE